MNRPRVLCGTDHSGGPTVGPSGEAGRPTLVERLRADGSALAVEAAEEIERLAKAHVDAGAREPDAMTHATHWRRLLDENPDGVTVRTVDPDRVRMDGAGPPFPVWIGRAP